MLRLLVSGLLLSSLRRSTALSFSNSSLLSRGVANTCRNLNYPFNMEEPFQKMEEEGVPRCDKPTEAAAPKKEEQDLPKLSAKEFRAYNSMAEHMDLFVSPQARVRGARRRFC